MRRTIIWTATSPSRRPTPRAAAYRLNNASAGFKDAGVNLALTYNFAQNWTGGGLIGYKRLLNDAEDSLVTKVGDKN